MVVECFQSNTGDGGKLDVSAALARILCDLGVEKSFGVVGGGIARFAEALLKSPIQVFHTRHEAGAAFAATETYFGTNKPSAVFVTTGPGLLNSLVGICAAKWDGAKLVLISASTNPQMKGRWPVQETSSYTMPADLFSSGAMFDYAIQMNDTSEITEIARRLQIGFSRPEGFIAHISIPTTMQVATIEQHCMLSNSSFKLFKVDTYQVDACLDLLDNEPFAIWIGFGARYAAKDVYRLAEKTGAAVMCTPRAKGIFPENHPQFIGVTGAGGHDSVTEYMQNQRPAYTLVLGTRLGEASSFWSPNFIPRKGFIHVDLNAEAQGVAYPDTEIIGIQAEIKEFSRALADRIKFVDHPNRQVIEMLKPPEYLKPNKQGHIRPQYLMQCMQKVVVENSDAVVMSESGCSFSWANHYLRFASPHRYRTSAEFGSMGHMTAGVVGAALVRKGKAVALVGDGAMLMNNEISTAVKYGAEAVWVVLNDSCYGIVHQGMQLLGFTPVETDMPTTDFAAFANAMGCDGRRVEHEVDLERILEEALLSNGPFVVDVSVSREDICPVMIQRVKSLQKQGVVVRKVR